MHSRLTPIVCIKLLKPLFQFLKKISLSVLSRRFALGKYMLDVSFNRILKQHQFQYRNSNRRKGKVEINGNIKTWIIILFSEGCTLKDAVWECVQL